MADNSVTILGMTFEQGEVLTSAKMNELASKVDVIINGINTEATRARAAEQSIQAQLQQMQTALTAAIAAERSRAMAAEALASGNATIVTEDGRITIGNNVYQLTKADDVFYHGTFSGNIDDIKGRANTGLWNYLPEVIPGNLVVTMYYLLVVADNQGNTYQYRFTGSPHITTISSGGVKGAYIQTRQFLANSNSWSSWATISGEVFEQNLRTLEAYNENFKMQATIFEGMNVNYELTTNKEHNPWDTDVVDDGEELKLNNGDTVLRYARITRVTP